jgi:hypothetical protein
MAGGSFAWPSPPDRLWVHLVPGILSSGLKRSEREVHTLTIKAYVVYFTTVSVFTLYKCRMIEWPMNDLGNILKGTIRV